MTTTQWGAVFTMTLTLAGIALMIVGGAPMWAWGLLLATTFYLRAGQLATDIKSSARLRAFIELWVGRKD